MAGCLIVRYKADDITWLVRLLKLKPDSIICCKPILSYFSHVPDHIVKFIIAKETVEDLVADHLANGLTPLQYY